MDANQFAEHMWNFNNYGITLAAICFGNEVGLFDLLMGEKEPVTSLEIAEKANMKERYVREWLGCMVAAQIVNIDQKSDTKQDQMTNRYFIPADRHGTIKGATAWGYAVVAWVRRFDQTKACFQKNGPWESGGKILDLGCGTGAFSITLARKYGKSEVTGLDASDKPLKIANDSLQKSGLTNLGFIKGDAHNLDGKLHNKFDLIFFCDCLHDLPDPKKALAETTKALKPDGKLVIIEFRPHSNHADNTGNLTAAMFYTCSMFCCLQNSLLPEQPRIGYGTCWGKEEMTKTIRESLDIDKTVDLPLLHAIYICSKRQTK